MREQNNLDEINIGNMDISKTDKKCTKQLSYIFNCDKDLKEKNNFVSLDNDKENQGKNLGFLHDHENSNISTIDKTEIVENFRSIDLTLENNFSLDDYLDLLKLELPSKYEQTSNVTDSKDRLIINYIELENFKSYYGINKMGPFGKNFSCVVGPNGSGKSNIFDCILFVFDYNVRKCRTKKLSELIHRSSYETCDFARVSIYFKRLMKKNDEDCDIEGSTFCITRKITKDNKSIFFFNNRKISREDLKKILKGNGLGLDHDRFLILQGEVESISLLKAKAESEDEDSMLSLMDDIIGTNRYKMSLEKVNNSILELQAKVAIVNARLRMSEKFRNMLEEKVKSSIEQNRIKNGITDLKYQKLLILKTKCLYQYDEIEKNLDEHKNIIDTKNEEICKLENGLKTLDDERMEVKIEYKECRKQDEIIKSSLTSSNMRLQEIKASHFKLEERLKLKEQKNDTLHQEIRKLENLPQDISKEKESNQRELKKICEIEEEFRIKKEKAEEIFEKERSSYASEYDAKQDIVIALQDKINDFKNGKNKLEFKLDQVTSEKNNIESEIKNLENFITGLNLSNQSNLDNKKAILENISVTEAELSNLKDRSKTYQAEIKEHEIDIMDKSKKYQILKQDYNSLIDQENSSPLLENYKFLIDLNFTGFKGRLGDLASIDKKYDIALSTLGGKLLDMFVVETVKDGQYLMDQLRINGKGRGTFMCIEEMNKKYGYGSKKTNKFDGTVRAFDLLENVSPDVKSCFYFVFKESLVVDTLDGVNHLKSKYSVHVPKIVTLNGNIFESLGKITGGGKPISGLIGKKDQIKPKIDGKLKLDIKKQLSDLNIIIENVKTRNTQLLGEKHKIDIDIKKKVLLIEELKKQLYFIEGNIKNGNTCLKIKNNSLEDLKKQLPNVNIDKDAFTKIVNEIKLFENKIEDTEKILSVNTELFNAVKNKVDNLYKELVEEHALNFNNCVENKERCQNLISQLQKKFNFLSKQYKFKMDEQERNENEIQELTLKISELQEEEEQISHDINNLIRKKEENDNFLKNLNEKLNSQSDVSKIKYQIIDLKNEIDKYQSIICTDKDKLKELKNKEIIYEEKITNLKYIFYNSMNTLPRELIEFRNDELFYTKRVDEAEKEFINSLNDGNCSISVPMVEIPLKNFSEVEFQIIIQKEEEIDEKLKIFKETYLAESNDDIVLKYLEKHEAYLGNLKQFNNINKIYNELKEKSDNWTIERIKEFNDGFNRISKYAKEVYQNITFGGDAELEPCDKFDPYNFGILFKVRPPGKSWKKMTNLSGGEKTLASLALVFALHEYNPTPLYIMDEIDAALDFRNVAIIGQYIKQKTLNAQFIVISLRKEMYELADKCIEIWKLDDRTRSACSDMNEVYEANKNCIEFNEVYSNSALKENLKNLLKLLKNVK